ncbi:cupin domain-containing protein [Candidatus Pacearchaeota archaeon]|nr:cupin domain-containing protein [Candidatus Pacearchaeota archaeon]
MNKIELNHNSLKKSYDKKIIRKFKDMKEKFKESNNIKNNPLLYQVYIKDFGCFETGLTVIEPGTINKEFYMTKGHKHQKPTKEIYILLKGKGKLIIQDKKTKILNLKKDKTYIIPKKSGHRLINTGDKKLEVLTIYSKNAGHSYNFKFKKRVFK